MTPHRSWGAWLVMALLAAGCGAGEHRGISIDDPWIREAPPNARALAGYMSLRNHGETPVALLFAASDAFERVELHISREEGGQMRMEQLDHVTLPPRESVAFSPGGLHLMLIGPKQPVTAGNPVRVELSFSDGSSTDVMFAVRDVRGSHTHMSH